ncbi:MAG: recombination protein RecR [Bacteroidetes bacterium]|nr:MAG: recombination protein RecR [Bacteroidota bacterium]MBL1145844.1 recombination protein RecR [Bacteroidota bacterium]MCB0803079.1 recombination protein RecR [Flavobacteriales bacterium]NOG58638.1 recombination protein RecR [Bacteroidota bacterium]
MEEFSSKLFTNAVEQFSTLPGVGKRTAMRLTLHLLKQSKDEVNQFSEAFIRLIEDIQYCNVCYNISETPQCEICSNKNRDESLICVVEDIRDIIAIESTGQYRGLYHVLGGKISPMEGIGPADLKVEELVLRIQKYEPKEIIMALSPTMEGDTTNFYLYKRIKSFNVQVSTIARGVAIGDELEYADTLTLGRSLQNRVLYENTFAQ